MRLSNLFISISTALVRYRLVLGILGLGLLFKTLYNIYNFRITRPAAPLDQPFYVGYQTPDVGAPKENTTILILVSNSDLDGAIRSLISLEEYFNKWFHYPVTFLNDQT